MELLAAAPHVDLPVTIEHIHGCIEYKDYSTNKT